MSDPALAPITGNPGDASVRWSDPSTYPGVDVVAEIRRAGEYAATKPGRYTDGRAFLRGWLQRKADEVARSPRPAPLATTGVDLSDPWEVAKARYEAEERERIAKLRAERKGAGGVA
ncbi:MAG TPA: hypothetical protein VFV33_12305 [Gemmatimonadaceae bacterium]|nr:hypothetical protein [Gemmatimonadaceae bacterium]